MIIKKVFCILLGLSLLVQPLNVSANSKVTISQSKLVVKVGNNKVIK